MEGSGHVKRRKAERAQTGWRGWDLERCRHVAQAAVGGQERVDGPSAIVAAGKCLRVSRVNVLTGGQRLGW